MLLNTVISLFVINCLITVWVMTFNDFAVVVAASPIFATNQYLLEVHRIYKSFYLDNSNCINSVV